MTEGKTAMEKAVEILNSARGAGDNEKAKLELLSQLKQLVFRDEPSLGSQFVEEIMQFQVEKQASVRKWVAEAAEDACEQDAKFSKDVLPTIRALIEDEDVHVVKRGTIALMTVFKKLLEYLRSDFTQNDQLWESAVETIYKVLERIRNADNDGVRTQSIKLIESVILLYTPTDEVVQDGFTINTLPSNHPVLKQDELQQYNEQYFNYLVESFPPPKKEVAESDENAQETPKVTATNMIVLTHTLANLAKQRSCLIQDVMPILLNLQQNTPEMKVSKIRSFNNALKTAFVNIAKLESTQSEQWLETIFEVLEEMNEHHARRGLERAKRNREKEEEEARKRRRKMAAQFTPDMTPTPLGPMPYSMLVEVLLTYFHRWGPEMGVPDATAMSHASMNAQTQFNVMAAEAGHFAQPVDSAPQTRDPRAQPRDPRKRDPRASTSTSDAAPQVSAASFRMGRAAQRSKTLAVPKLSKDTMNKLKKDAFFRIVKREAKINVCGRSRIALRRVLLTRLVHSSEVNLRNSLLDHVMDDFKARHDLAVRWLYQEWASQKLKGGSSNYATLLKDLLSKLEPKLEPNDKLFTQLLVEVPFVTDHAFGVVEKFCEDENRAALGLATLLELLLKRTNPVRESSLNKLLDYSVSSIESVRPKAIKIIASKVFPLPQYAEKVEEFAKKSLVDGMKFSLEEKSDNAEEDKKNLEEEIKRRLYLYISLCTKKHQLLGGLVEAYVDASNDVKAVVHGQVRSFVKHIGLSPYMVKLIGDFPEGGAPFILRIVHALAADGKVQGQLVTTVKHCYQNTGDPRFLIPVISALPKKDVVEALPKLVALSDGMKTALQKLVYSPKPPLSPADLLFELHLIPLDKDGSGLKKIMQAMQYCFTQKKVFNEQVLAVVLQRLVSLPEIPLLFMRTVQQTLNSFRSLVDFMMGILNQCVSKQVWNHPQLFEGFILCCRDTKPQSFRVLLGMPAEPLRLVLKKDASLKEALKEFVNESKVPVPGAVQEMLDAE